MEMLKPVLELSRPFLRGFRRRPGEPASPQNLDDEPQQIAKMRGRQNASYESVWEAVEKAYPKWQPVRCNSYRRALLLTSSAIQHRTKAFEVWRRGRIVCIKLIPAEEMERRRSAVHEVAAG